MSTQEILESLYGRLGLALKARRRIVEDRANGKNGGHAHRGLKETGAEQYAKSIVELLQDYEAYPLEDGS